jgi:hypothetical protein
MRHAGSHRYAVTLSALPHEKRAMCPAVQGTGHGFTCLGAVVLVCAAVDRGTLPQALPPDVAAPRVECTVENPVQSTRRSSTMGFAGSAAGSAASPPVAGACVMCKKPLLTGLSAAGSVFDASMYCSQQCETFYNAMKHKGFDVKTVGELGLHLDGRGAPLAPCCVVPSCPFACPVVFLLPCPPTSLSSFLQACITPSGLGPRILDPRWPRPACQHHLFWAVCPRVPILVEPLGPQSHWGRGRPGGGGGGRWRQPAPALLGCVEGPHLEAGRLPRWPQVLEAAVFCGGSRVSCDGS